MGNEVEQAPLSGTEYWQRVAMVLIRRLGGVVAITYDEFSAHQHIEEVSQTPEVVVLRSVAPPGSALDCDMWIQQQKGDLEG